MATRGGNGKRVQQNKRIMVTNPNMPSTKEMETSSNPLLSGCLPNPQISKPAAGTLQVRSHPSSTMSRAAPTQATPNAPMSVHGNPLEDDTTVVEPPPKKRGRGKTTNQVIAKLSRHEKIDLELSPDMRAIGINSAKLANFLGPLVRCTQFVPVQVENWSQMEDLGINASLFKMTSEAFNISPDQLEGARWLVERTASTAWRNHLYHIKKYYYNVHKTDEARLAAKPPPNMTIDDWKFLIKKFGSDEHKAISERNSANRSKVVLKPTTGSASHAKVFDDETKKNGGVAPGMLEFYTKAYTHKDGTPADAESARIIAETNEEIAHQEGENADPVNKDKIFQLVKEGNPERNKKRNTRPQVDSAVGVARLKQLEENLALEAARRQEMEAKLQEMYAEKARREEMDRIAESEKREEVERRMKELADDTERNKELNRRFEQLEDDRARNAELARKLEECMSQVNNCNSMCASLMSGGNEHEAAWDEEETYDEEEEANRKMLKLAGKKHNQM